MSSGVQDLILLLFCFESESHVAQLSLKLFIFMPASPKHCVILLTLRGLDSRSILNSVSATDVLQVEYPIPLLEVGERIK